VHGTLAVCRGPCLARDMSDPSQAPTETIAEASWIDEAASGDLDALFIRVRETEPVLPPNRRGRYPSRLMLEGAITRYTDDELRVAAKLARHLTAAGDLTYERNAGPFSHLRKTDGTWWASRMTWTGAGRPCATVEEAAAVLMSGIHDDLADLQPMLDAFDAEHGHAPASAPVP
jgi:hypothetical protein